MPTHVAKDLGSFLTLFILFFFAIEMNERDRLNTAEIVFMVYGFGYCLDKIAAMQEHGIKGRPPPSLLA